MDNVLSKYCTWPNLLGGKLIDNGYKYTIVDFYESHSYSFFTLVKSCCIQLKCKYVYTPKKIIALFFTKNINIQSKVNSIMQKYIKDHNPKNYGYGFWSNGVGKHAYNFCATRT
jgi:hypothetical protein